MRQKFGFLSFFLSNIAYLCPTLVNNTFLDPAMAQPC